MRVRSHDQATALESDLELAERVYRSLLPKRLTAGGIDVVTRVQPFNRIGGDYATVFPTRDGRIYVCVSDVTAHGISSALLVTRVNSFVRERVPLANHPCEVVQERNTFLCDHFSGLGMSLSFFCATVDARRREFAYAGCGHPPALLFKAAGAGGGMRLESQHTLLGLFPEISHQCQIDRVSLDPGDRIILYTDGLIEARNEEREAFGAQRLAEIVSRCVDENLEGELLADRVLGAVNSFRGQGSRDDLLLMVISIQ